MKPRWHLCLLGAILAAAIPAAALTQQSGAAGNTPQQQPSQNGSGTAANGTAPEAQPTLNLTADQRTKIKAIHKEQMSQIQSVRNDSTLTDSEKHLKIKQIRQDSEQQIMALLTSDQQAAWKDLRAERHQPRKQAPPSSNSSSRPEAGAGATPASPD